MNNITCIYKITSPSNKVYIGQSRNISKRINNYSNLNCKKQRKLYNSLKFYGWDNHIFSIISELPNDINQTSLDNYEILYWELYKQCNCEMLNCREPGKHGKLLLEAKEKIRDFNKTRIGNKNSMFGRTHSEETKEKMRLMRLGKKPSLEAREKQAIKISIPIKQYDLDGNFIKEWDSASKAGRILNLNKKVIQAAVRNIRPTAYNFVWKRSQTCS